MCAILLQRKQKQEHVDIGQHKKTKQKKCYLPQSSFLCVDEKKAAAKVFDEMLNLLKIHQLNQIMISNDHENVIFVCFFTMANK